MDLQDFNIVIDCGHGGIDDKGNYTTSPNKMHTFPNGDVIYEGVVNRKIGKYLYEELEKEGTCPSFTVFPNDATDLSLSKRVELINNFDKDITYAVSIHNNASKNHNASGMEIWTSPGETESDTFAGYIGRDLIDAFPTHKFRKDYSDGDLDKEAKFKILVKTKCPAVLIECAFFDNEEDKLLLEDDAWLQKMAKAICSGIIRYLKTFS